MAASGTFGEFLQDQLASLGHVTVRRMFGGAGVYCDGLMFGLVSDDTLYFRVDDGNRGAFEAEGLAPFSLRRQGPYDRAALLARAGAPVRRARGDAAVGAGRVGGGAAGGGEEEIDAEIGTRTPMSASERDYTGQTGASASLSSSSQSAQQPHPDVGTNWPGSRSRICA